MLTKRLKILQADKAFHAKDNLEYKGKNYTVPELYKVLVTEGRIKRKSALSEREKFDRKDNMYPLWESPDGGLYAVVDSAIPIGKHNDTPDDQFNAEELKKGIEIEQEHTDDKELAKAIAKDHLTEIKDYYTRLIKMEAEAKEKI